MDNLTLCYNIHFGPLQSCRLLCLHFDLTCTVSVAFTVPLPSLLVSDQKCNMVKFILMKIFSSRFYIQDFPLSSKNSITYYLVEKYWLGFYAKRIGLASNGHLEYNIHDFRLKVLSIIIWLDWKTLMTTYFSDRVFRSLWFSKFKEYQIQHYSNILFPIKASNLGHILIRVLYLTSLQELLDLSSKSLKLIDARKILSNSQSLHVLYDFTSNFFE